MRHGMICSSPPPKPHLHELATMEKESSNVGNEAALTSNPAAQIYESRKAQVYVHPAVAGNTR